jgi:hypothetical protein
MRIVRRGATDERSVECAPLSGYRMSSAEAQPASDTAVAPSRAIDRRVGIHLAGLVIVAIGRRDDVARHPEMTQIRPPTPEAQALEHRPYLEELELTWS